MFKNIVIVDVDQPMAYCIHTAWYVGAAKRLLRGHPLGNPKTLKIHRRH